MESEKLLEAVSSTRSESTPSKHRFTNSDVSYEEYAKATSKESLLPVNGVRPLSPLPLEGAPSQDEDEDLDYDDDGMKMKPIRRSVSWPDWAENCEKQLVKIHPVQKYLISDRRRPKTWFDLNRELILIVHVTSWRCAILWPWLRLSSALCSLALLYWTHLRIIAFPGDAVGAPTS